MLSKRVPILLDSTTTTTTWPSILIETRSYESTHEDKHKDLNQSTSPGFSKSKFALNNQLVLYMRISVILHYFINHLSVPPPPPPAARATHSPSSPAAAPAKAAPASPSAEAEPPVLAPTAWASARATSGPRRLQTSPAGKVVISVISSMKIGCSRMCYNKNEKLSNKKTINKNRFHQQNTACSSIVAVE